MIGNQARLNIQQKQLLVKTDERETTIPIEDTGVLVIDHYQTVLTHAVLHKLLENNAAVITCNEKHLPTGLLLNLDGHTQQSEKFKAQIEATEPLRKQLWQQTVKAKLQNQASVLDIWEIESKPIKKLIQNVLSGDTSNQEAQGAKYYWKVS